MLNNRWVVTSKFLSKAVNVQVLTMATTLQTRILQCDYNYRYPKRINDQMKKQ